MVNREHGELFFSFFLGGVGPELTWADALILSFPREPLFSWPAPDLPTLDHPIQLENGIIPIV